MTELEQLAEAIAALEAQRAVLGETVVETLLPLARAAVAARQANGSPAEAPIVKKQRKQVTILFADVSGFTAMTEALDAEDASELMNALWQRLDAVLVAHGGKIDKHMGDAVMALWGAAAAHEDDPEQAIKAALAMQKEMNEWHQAIEAIATLHTRLAIRIGINTGLALLGEIGTTREFTAIGDTVNVAARLEQAAPVGGILISHATYRHVRGVFDVVAQPPLTVKGKTEPLQVYLVERTKPRAFRLLSRGVEGLETRLVGRATELQQLQTAFRTMVHKHQTHTFLVVAEAGLGKSRLMHEFIHWAEVQGMNYYLFRGRATPSAGETPYTLLRDLLAFRFEVRESDSLATARAKLEAGMAALCPTDAQIQEKAHFIGHLVGWDFSASPYLRGLLGDVLQIRAVALHFLSLFFHAVAERLPVVLVLEDVHWADHGSLDVVRHVVGNLPPGTRLLVIVNARSSLFERIPNWQLAGQTRLDLTPLTEADSMTLVADILRQVPDLPPALRDLIVQQADGNPFYVEELIKMLIDEKVILPTATAWRILPERLATLHVPPTLTGVLQARLDSLTPVERLVLQRGAVLGRTFWDTAVQALGNGSGHELGEVQAALAAAERRELLFQHANSAFGDAREYWFKHALLRDVVYDTVLKRDRADYHARAATWLTLASSARRSEYLPQVAAHHEKAGNLAEAAAGFEQAGDQAMQVSAFANALRFYTHVLALNQQGEASSLPTAPKFFLKLANVHYRLGGFAAAQNAIAQVQALAHTASVADSAAALALLGEITSELGDYAHGQKLLAEAVALARTSGDDSSLCRSLYALGYNHWRLVQFAEAQQALNESLVLARTLGDVTSELFALLRLGLVQQSKNALTEAAQIYTEVHARALAVGNRERAMMALSNLGVVSNRGGHYAQAHEYLQQALALAREIGAQRMIAVTLINLADANCKLGLLPAAHTDLHDGLTLALRIGMIPSAMWAVTVFANLAFAEGQTLRALTLLGFASHQSAWTADDQSIMEKTLAGWGLDPAVVEAGLAQGATLEWDAMMQELLQHK